MDPNVTLARLRQFARYLATWESWRTADASPEKDGVISQAVDMAEHFEALDNWITAGGLLPVVWTKERT